MIVACTRLLRGSGYVGFNGETPEQPEHAALASEYAHVTAPLRRLVDRYAGEVCVALCAGDRGAVVGARAARRAAQDACRTPATARTSTSTPCSTWSRPPCCTRTSARVPRRGGPGRRGRPEAR